MLDVLNPGQDFSKMTLQIRPEHREERCLSGSTGAKSIENLKAEIQQVQNVFYLLGFASEFWLDHSSGFNDSSKEFSAILILRKKLLTSPLPAAARPWDPEPWHEGSRSLEYAMENRHATLFAAILRTSYLPRFLTLTSGDAALLLRADAVHKTERTRARSFNNFWEGDWEQFFRTLNLDDQLIELQHDSYGSLTKLRKSIPNNPEPRPSLKERPAWLFIRSSALGAIEKTTRGQIFRVSNCLL